jgi:hypothetical protein
MAGESIVLDPYAESTANAPLWLHSRSNGSLAPGVGLSADTGHSYPTPEPEAVWVSSPDTEGELLGATRPQRRTITARLQIVEPGDAAAVNACTNPVFATGTTGWTNNSLTTFASGVYQAVDTGVAFLPGFDTGLHTVGDALADSANFSFSAVNGVAQTASVWVWANLGSVRIEVWTAAPAAFVTSATVTSLDGWTRLVLPFTPNATATWTVRLSQAASGAHNAWWTGVQIGPRDPYFDGDTPGCYWTGTRNASTSQRRAPGGKRFAGIKADVEDKISAMNALGGTYRRTLPTGEHITFDVLQARLIGWDEQATAEQYRYIKGDVEFVCKPYGRGPSVTV